MNKYPTPSDNRVTPTTVISTRNIQERARQALAPPSAVAIVTRTPITVVHGEVCVNRKEKRKATAMMEKFKCVEERIHCEDGDSYNIQHGVECPMYRKLG